MISWSATSPHLAEKLLPRGEAPSAAGSAGRSAARRTRRGDQGVRSGTTREPSQHRNGGQRRRWPSVTRSAGERHGAVAVGAGGAVRPARPVMMPTPVLGTHGILDGAGRGLPRWRPMALSSLDRSARSGAARRVSRSTLRLHVATTAERQHLGRTALAPPRRSGWRMLSADRPEGACDF